MTTSLRLLRLLCRIEGISLLLLLFVAMPLKHLAEMPLAVRYVGMAHGLLWLGLVALLIAHAWKNRWSRGRSTAVFVSSVLPFGFLVMDRRMAAWQVQPQPPG
jgi:integral membrane protein